MIEPDKTGIAVFGIKIRPVVRQNMRVQVDFPRHKIVPSDRAADRAVPLKRLYRSGLLYLFSTALAGPSGIVTPEIEHGLAEMLDDIGAIEMNVFDEGATVVAIENDVLLLARGTTALDYHAQSIGRPLRRMWDIGRNKKGFTFTDQVIDDAIRFANPDFDIAFKLVKIFFRIDQMKIVSGIRPGDDHNKEIPAVVKVPIANRRFKQLPILLDPILQVNRGLHLCRPGRLAR